MRYKGCEIAVINSNPPGKGWTWVVNLANDKAIRGKAFSRWAAVRLAQAAIEREKGNSPRPDYRVMASDEPMIS